jgi:hypothetical protein
LKYFDVQTDIKSQWRTQSPEEYQAQIKLGMQIQKERLEKGQSQTI